MNPFLWAGVAALFGFPWGPAGSLVGAMVGFVVGHLVLANSEEGTSKCRHCDAFLMQDGRCPRCDGPWMGGGAT